MSAKTSKIITIGRSYGAGGRTVGKLISDALEIPYYDMNILKETAEKSGLAEKYIESIDEKEINDAALYLSVGFMTPAYTSVRQIAANAQREVIEKIAKEGPCVIVGRRADEILRDKPNLLKVFIAASPEDRIKRIMERDGLDEKAARKMISRADKERAAYHDQFGSDSWGMASQYDICLNTSYLSFEEAAKIIISIAAN